MVELRCHGLRDGRPWPHPAAHGLSPRRPMPRCSRLHLRLQVHPCRQTMRHRAPGTGGSCQLGPSGSILPPWHSVLCAAVGCTGGGWGISSGSAIPALLATSAPAMGQLAACRVLASLSYRGARISSSGRIAWSVAWIDAWRPSPPPLAYALAFGGGSPRRTLIPRPRWIDARPGGLTASVSGAGAGWVVRNPLDCKTHGTGVRRIANIA